MQRLRDRGGKVVSISPLRDDVDGDCEWFAPVPGTDVAIMLALGLRAGRPKGWPTASFLETYCTGYEPFERYLLGADDGTPKSPRWASAICGLPADALTALGPADGRRAHDGHRQLVAATGPARRAGAVDGAGAGRDARPDRASRRRFRARVRFDERSRACHPLRCRLPTFPQGLNPVSTFIPVAAVSDMLLHPGEEFDYNGRRLTYPDIKCVYWAGGNPFHHHQNIPRLRRALARPDTIVVHDPYWTAMAKHADIVVPSTTAYERDDYSGSRNDPLLVAMPALAEPYAESRDDYTTFAALAAPTRLRRRSSPRAAPPRSGWCTCTTSGPPNWISPCHRSRSSGAPAGCVFPPRPG